jgi:hypothetical protein
MLAEKNSACLFREVCVLNREDRCVLISTHTSALVDMANVIDVWVTLCNEHVGTWLLVVYDTPSVGD